MVSTSKITMDKPTNDPILKECTCEEVESMFECRCSGPALLDIPNSLHSELSNLYNTVFTYFIFLIYC